jgi:hypothetical protein
MDARLVDDPLESSLRCERQKCRDGAGKAGSLGSLKPEGRRVGGSEAHRYVVEAQLQGLKRIYPKDVAQARRAQARNLDGTPPVPPSAEPSRSAQADLHRLIRFPW